MRKAAREQAVARSRAASADPRNIPLPPGSGNSISEFMMDVTNYVDDSAWDEL